MRKALLALAASTVWTATLPAQTHWAEKMFKAGTSHDFGTVPRGTQSVHRFKIVNIYAVEMEITRLKPSCGCVVATCPKRVLAAREESYIEVRMDGTRYVGAKVVTVAVSVGPKFVSTANLRVSAVGRADVVFNPGEVNFGLVAQGSSATKTVDLEYAGPLRWQISEVVAKGLPYEVKARETYRRPGQVGYRLTVSLKADAPVGVLKHEVLLKTNDKAGPVVPLLVEGIVQSSLSVSPPSLDLGTVKAGEALKRRVIVRGASAFKIVGIDGLGTDIAVEGGLPPAAADVQILTLKVAIAAPGAFRRVVKIRTSAQEAPLAVTLDGIAAK